MCKKVATGSIRIAKNDEVFTRVVIVSAIDSVLVIGAIRPRDTNTKQDKRHTHVVVIRRPYHA